MKKYNPKDAFSLIELMVVLTIISIVAIMGLQVAKKGMVRAYYQYYRTGFDTLESVLTSTEHTTLNDYYTYDQKRELTQDVLNQSTKINFNNLNIDSPFGIALISIFDSEDDNGTTVTANATNNGLLISHRNGIRYDIIFLAGQEGNENETYLIQMSVPKMRERNSTEATVALLYRPNNNTEGLKLIPTERGDISLADQTGILPYMLDDTPNGTMGKIVTSLVTNADGELELDAVGNPITDTSYTPIDNRYSFKQAYCTTINEDGINIDDTVYLTCNAADRVEEKNDGAILRRIKQKRI